jgi:hypothetical protein
MVLGVAMAETPRSFRFAFGAGDVPDDFVLVSPDAGFGKEYGFDLGTRPVAGSSFVTSDKPSYFSVAVPEGNYNVTVKLGDAAGDCVTTVKAEPRRLMLEHVHTAAGRQETRTFSVNVRSSLLAPPPANAPGGNRVLLNNREQGVLHWDDKLTLEFSDTRPCLAAIEDSARRSSHYFSGRRFHGHRSAARAVHELGANADAILSPRHRDRESCRIERDSEAVHQ